MSSEFGEERQVDVGADTSVDAPERREFLKKAGKFAVVTPAAVTVLLSTSMDASATQIFRSGGGGVRPKKKMHKKVRRRIRKRVKRRLLKRISSRRRFF